MSAPAYLGSKVRRLRCQQGLTQAALAGRLGISPSYLNLIERNQRSLTVPLLLKLAGEFEVDLGSFAEDDDARLAGELQEIFSDDLFADLEVEPTELRDLVTQAPGAARGLRLLYRAYRDARESTRTLAARLEGEHETEGLAGARLPSEEVSDLVQEAGNHFAELEEAADTLRDRAALVAGDLFRGLADHLEEVSGIHVEVVEAEALAGAVRRLDERRGRLLLSEVLPVSSRTFQLAHQVGLLTLDDLFERIVARGRLTTEESRRLARVALANYFAGAVAMPYERFLAEARRVRYDVELLEHRFGTSFEQVCHRLTTLARPGDEGVPLHLVRIDIAGNISKRFSGSGIRFARYSGACPRWNVHAAFLTPGAIRTQVSRMPDGATYFCVARTVRKAGGGHRVPQSRLAIGLGCELRHARELVYADGIDLEDAGAAVPVGTTCRLCERTDCRQRAFPPLHHRLDVDENVRGLSFYYTPEFSGSGDER